MRNAELLAQNQFFDSLSPEDCEALGARLNEVHVKPGDYVFRFGDAGQSMYIVRSGSVRILLPGKDGDSDQVLLKEARAGEYFGELSLFDDKPRSASVQATIDTVLLELTNEVFSDHIERSPKAAMAILSEMAERLRETNALLSQRAARDVVRELEENLTWGQRLADRIAELNGSWTFIGFLIFLTLGWAALNHFAVHPFDAYPYTFFNLVLAILVALQGPLIVMSQNRQTTKDRAQADTDYRVNLKNEVGIERIRIELSAFHAEMDKRVSAIERALKPESSTRKGSKTEG
ncbi:MAG: DUF1003 domain-containing protein [Polyangiaceae bacterium]